MFSVFLCFKEFSVSLCFEEFDFLYKGLNAYKENSKTTSLQITN